MRDEDPTLMLSTNLFPHPPPMERGFLFFLLDSGPSVKDHEHTRRSKKVLAKVHVDSDAIADGPQQAFLSNTENKIQFIKLLAYWLLKNNQTVLVASNDADMTIVRTAIQCCRTVHCR